MNSRVRAVALGLIAVVIASDARAQFVQQGDKLVGQRALGNASQGTSTALSSDGNTALVGGYSDADFRGATWVYSRGPGGWTQTAKLVGDGAWPPSFQGISAALSADGNTAIVGGPEDAYPSGSVWVFARAGDAWVQQGPKFRGSGASGVGYQGTSVAVSADGGTAVIGAYVDHSLNGAAWVFTRAGDVWTQEGERLVAADASGNPLEGIAVAISADGNTAIVGGDGDGGGTGAAWVYTRSAGAWTQQGAKLVGSGAAGRALQGISVAISADGNTALIGGSYDNSYAGAAWVFTRTGGAWSQQGSKLVGTGAAGAAFQGVSVALSADGNTAIVGGSYDADQLGAAWVYRRHGETWSQQGAKLVGTGAVGSAQQGSAVAISGDGKTAMLGGFRDDGGVGAAWAFFDARVNQSPDCSRAEAVPLEIVQADHRFVPVSITGVTDPDGDPVTIAVTRVTQDEPLGIHDDAVLAANGYDRTVAAGLTSRDGAQPLHRGGGSDATEKGCADAVLAADGGAWVRAERSGSGNGRVYTLWFTATDPGGASCEGSVHVCVPHDAGQPVCGDDGQAFNSLGPCHADGADAGISTGVEIVGDPATYAASGPGDRRTLEYALSAADDVEIGLYDVSGRRIAAVPAGWQGAGRHAVSWEALSGGSHLAAGVYFVRVQAGGGRAIRRFAVMR